MSFTRYAITFGEVSILHVGGKEFGNKRETGFSVEELCTIANTINNYDAPAADI